MLLVIEYIMRHGLLHLLPEYEPTPPLPATPLPATFPISPATPPVGNMWLAFLFCNRTDIRDPNHQRFIINPPAGNSFWFDCPLERDDVTLQQNEVFQTSPHLAPLWQRWTTTDDWSRILSGRIATW